jgi:hypothetical protein
MESDSSSFETSSGLESLDHVEPDLTVPDVTQGSKQTVMQRLRTYFNQNPIVKM